MTDKRLGLSEREYVCRAGISRGAVQKARQSAQLVLHDASASRPPGRRRPILRNGTHAPSPRRGYKPVPDVALGALAETLNEQGLTAPQASGMTFLQGAHRQRGAEGAAATDGAAAEGKASWSTSGAMRTVESKGKGLCL